MRVLVVLVLLLASVPQASAGAWTQEPGAVYVKLWDRSLFGQGALTGERMPQFESVPRFQDHQLNVYAEFGLHELVTLVAALTPVGYASIDGQSTVYMGPMAGGFRVALRQGEVPVALEVRAGRAPDIGDEVLFERAYARRDDQVGTIVYQAAVENNFGEVQLQVGRSLRIRQTDAWVVGHVGYRVNGSYQNAFTGFAQIGFKMRVEWDLHFLLYAPIGDPIVTNISGAGDTRYIGAGVGIAIPIHDHVNVVLAAEGVFYAASNAATPSFQIGLSAH